MTQQDYRIAKSALITLNTQQKKARDEATANYYAALTAAQRLTPDQQRDLCTALFNTRAGL